MNMRLLRLFGGAPGGEVDALVKEIGPTRLAFWDCPLAPRWVSRVRERNLLPTEAKSENSINRIAGVAENPRFTERVPAGAQFDFRLSIKKLAGDGPELIETVLQGLKLLELDSVGGSGSRGYGKVKFVNLKIDDADCQARFDAVKPFER